VDDGDFASRRRRRRRSSTHVASTDAVATAHGGGPAAAQPAIAAPATCALEISPSTDLTTDQPQPREASDDAPGPPTTRQSCTPPQSESPIRIISTEAGMLYSTASIDMDFQMRMMLYENIFYRIDVDFSGALSAREAVSALSFLSSKLTRKQAMKEVSKADIDSDGKIQAWEWIILCTTLLSDLPKELIELGISTYQAAQNNEARRPRWRAVGKQIDMSARFWVLLLYLAILGLLFAVEFHDPYGTGENSRATSNSGETYDGTQMYTGVWATSMTTKDLLVALVVPALLICMLACWVVARVHMHQREALRERQRALVRKGILDRRGNSMLRSFTGLQVGAWMGGRV